MPAITALAFLIVAMLAWALTIVRMRGMDDMMMGLGAFGPFIVTWTAMMIAMMLPTALPLIFDFAQRAAGRPGGRIATLVLAATYLGVWLGFGVLGYWLYNLLGMPWANQRVAGGAVLTLAGIYALTPVKRASEALCRERCALHGPLPFSLMRCALVAGSRYSLSCLGCSLGLMVAMVLIGMTSLVWMVVLAAFVLIYKIAPAPAPRATGVLSLALILLGGIYAMTG